MAGKIFISYRRSDSAWAARALFERLWRSFPQRIFIDLEGIALGADFTESLDAQLAGCHAMLAIIGPGWLAQINERLGEADEDFVRIELARALQRGIPVLPVLVDGAQVPRARDLPDDLKALTRRNAVSLAADTFDAQALRITREVQTILQAAAQPPARVREAWMHDEGRDEFGRWASLRVYGVTQRLRWIEPGEFWMGSTEAERARFTADLAGDQRAVFDTEQPRHRVRLGQGFWLADTACTQALWQTLVGGNPSHFNGHPELPVEMVSWEDVTRQFLPALNGHLKGVQALLPTEAQWEYACRAGSDSAFHFGDSITPQEANFDGNFPPPGVPVGLFRERTVQVKALPANAWGLFQMHGNVWEWCADAPRRYEAQAVQDPLGAPALPRRVLRGGSWYVSARRTRCAFRFAAAPQERKQILGFRFALKPQA